MRPKNVESYLPDRPAKVSVPCRVDVRTINRARDTARRLDLRLGDVVDAGIQMFCDRAEQKKRLKSAKSKP